MARKKKAPARKSTSVAAQLHTVLADIYLMALKTHGFHWNVESPLFPQLHELFGKHYEALFEAADVVAERLRALDEVAPASFAQFTRLANITEETKAPSAQAMLAQLLADYGILEADLHKAIHVADAADDEGTEDMLTGLLRDAQKQGWMLRAMLRGR